MKNESLHFCAVIWGLRLELGAQGRGAPGLVSEQYCSAPPISNPPARKETDWRRTWRLKHAAPWAEVGPQTLEPARPLETESGGPTYLVLDVGMDPLQHPLTRVLVGQIGVHLCERQADTWGRRSPGPPQTWLLGPGSSQIWGLSRPAPREPTTLSMQMPRSPVQPSVALGGLTTAHPSLTPSHFR